MIKFFRNLRKHNLMKGKTSQYLKYAIGEIVLVMIGILLALQVNNWNENRKQQNELKSVLKIIANDMATDTVASSRIIKFYEENQKNSIKIVNREITKDNYKDCLPCFGLITTYQPFNIQTRGVERLRTISETQSKHNDSLVADIIEVYSHLQPLIEKSNDRMEEEILTNFKDLQEKSWFVDLFQGNFTPEIIDYFVLSNDYRKRVLAHSILASRNHLNTVKLYHENAKEILKQLNSRLEL